MPRRIPLWWCRISFAFSQKYKRWYNDGSVYAIAGIFMPPFPPPEPGPLSLRLVPGGPGAHDVLPSLAYFKFSSSLLFSAFLLRRLVPDLLDLPSSGAGVTDRPATPVLCKQIISNRYQSWQIGSDRMTNVPRPAQNLPYGIHALASAASGTDHILE